MSFAGIESGVGGDAFDGQSVVADAFARGLDCAARSGGGLEDENGGGFAGERFGDCARGAAADFFVGNQEDGDRAWQAGVPGLQGFDGVEHQGDAGFHVEHAGAVQAAVGFVAGHGGERAERIDGVEVAEEQDGFIFFARSGNRFAGCCRSRWRGGSGASAEASKRSARKRPMRSAAGLLSLGDSISTNSRMVRTRAGLLGLRNSGGARASWNCYRASDCFAPSGCAIFLLATMLAPGLHSSAASRLRIARSATLQERTV